jgi:DNA invertase Pin-like site-specific DNA recombinase
MPRFLNSSESRARSAQVIYFNPQPGSGPRIAKRTSFGNSQSVEARRSSTNTSIEASRVAKNRPAMNELLQAVHKRKCDVVLVWRMDRWAHSLRNSVNSLADLEARGVAFVSLRDNIDLTTPSGRLMVQIIGAMAEFERALIQERVKAALRHARATGKNIGRPSVSVDGRQVAALRKAGSTWRQICKLMDLSRGTAQWACNAQKDAPRLPKHVCGPISSRA